MFEKKKEITFNDENPVILSIEEWEGGTVKQVRWCHLVTSKPLLLSLVTKPNLRVLDCIASEHFLHVERFDFAYSATTDDSDVAIVWREAFSKTILEWIGMKNLIQVNIIMKFEL